MGATICRQVHRRVDCVIATPSALSPIPTQRIRQAWKRNIPVMTIQYIQDCIQQQTIIPIPTIADITILGTHIHHHMVVPNPYRILPPSTSPSSKETTKTAKKSHNAIPKVSGKEHPDDDNNNTMNDTTNTNTSAVINVQERVLDLGCCCVCHDDDNDNGVHPTTRNCEWCTDCSYTRQNQ